MQQRACLKAPTKLPRLLPDGAATSAASLGWCLKIAWIKACGGCSEACTSVALSARAEAAKTHLITVGETTFGKVLDTRVLCVPFHDWRTGVS